MNAVEMSKSEVVYPQRWLHRFAVLTACVTFPLVVVGGGCGQLKGGRHVRYPNDTPMMNLGLSLLDKVGVELEHIGDSTGRLANL